MAAKTSIEWTRGDDGQPGRTWNPVRGCSRVSEGCRACYAERITARMSKPGMWGEGFATMTKAGPRWTGKVALVESALDLPLRWKRPSRIFVNSVSDLFHEALPDEAIDAVFAAMALAPRHTFQILTKRPERMRNWMAGRSVDPAEFLVAAALEHTGLGFEDVDCTLGNVINGWSWWAGVKPAPPPSKLDGTVKAWPLPNVWLGVSCEDQATADERVPLLLQTPAAVRFVSAEPLLGEVNLNLGRDTLDTWSAAPPIDWVIAGGESGPGARGFDLEWARSLSRQCGNAGVAFFMKQIGSRPYTETWNAARQDFETTFLDLDDRKGGSMEEWPADLRVRQFPAGPHA